MEFPLLLLFLGMNTTAFHKLPTENSTITKLSPEIMNELKDFKTLIPETILDELIAKHYLIDKDFRVALSFIRNGLDELLQKVQQIPEIIEILNFLHLNDVNATITTTASNIEGRFYKFQQHHYYQNLYSYIAHRHSQHLFEQAKNEQHQLQPQLTTHELAQLRATTHHRRDVDADYDDAATTIDKSLEALPQLKIVLLSDVDGIHATNSIDDTSKLYAYDLATFAGFVEEVAQHIPQSNLVQMITEKRQKSAAFAEFYAALKSASFKPMVDAALNSTNLVDVLKTLSDNRIYVSTLKPIGWTVLSWCPPL